MIVILAELILTYSSTAYISFLLTGIIFVLINKNVDQNFKKVFIIIILMIFVVMYFFKYDILDYVIFSKLKSGSYIARFSWNKYAFNQFKKSILIGIGYKKVRGSSLVLSLLGELGIVGFIAYICFNTKIIVSPINVNGKINLSKNNELLPIVFAIISTVLCQLIAIPDLDFCVYWFWLYIYSMSIKNTT
jgi:hypothetical protein